MCRSLSTGAGAIGHQSFIRDFPSCIATPASCRHSSISMSVIGILIKYTFPVVLNDRNWQQMFAPPSNREKCWIYISPLFLEKEFWQFIFFEFDEARTRVFVEVSKSLDEMTNYYCTGMTRSWPGVVTTGSGTRSGPTLPLTRDCID